MNRRRMIAAIGLGISLSGCLGSDHHSGVIAALPEGLEDVTLQGLEQEESPVDPRADPVLEVDWDTRSLAIEGNVYVGSSECMRAVVESVERTDGTLEFVIAPGKSPQHPDNSLINVSCTEDMSPDAYRVQSPVPAGVDRVEVVERDAEGDTRAVSATAASE